MEGEIILIFAASTPNSLHFWLSNSMMLVYLQIGIFPFPPSPVFKATCKNIYTPHIAVISCVSTPSNIQRKTHRVSYATPDQYHVWIQICGRPVPYSRASPGSDVVRDIAKRFCAFYPMCNGRNSHISADLATQLCQNVRECLRRGASLFADGSQLTLKDAHVMRRYFVADWKLLRAIQMFNAPLLSTLVYMYH